jgi:methylated-DNA-protein-cysteine methyltransferase-like protein
MPSSRRDPEARRVTAHMSRVYTKILAVVRRIPRGRVMTYGMVAAAAGMPRGARVVGYCMRASGGAVPWHRVLGRRAAGTAGVSIKDPVGGGLQRQLLEKEGVKFSRTGAVRLAEWGWGWELEARPRTRRK